MVHKVDVRSFCLSKSMIVSSASSENSAISLEDSRDRRQPEVVSRLACQSMMRFQIEPHITQRLDLNHNKYPGPQIQNALVSPIDFCAKPELSLVYKVKWRHVHRFFNVNGMYEDGCDSLVGLCAFQSSWPHERLIRFWKCDSWAQASTHEINIKCCKLGLLTPCVSLSTRWANSECWPGVTTWG